MRPHFSRLVDAAESGVGLLDWLSARYRYRSRENWQNEIAAGRVTVDDRVGSPETILEAGQSVHWRPEPKPEPPVDLDCRILYEDARLFAVNKPGDLPCHPAGAYYAHTLWAWLRRQGRSTHLANRLDRETSGIVLVATDKKEARRLTRIFQRRQVQKTYLAVVHGRLTAPIHAAGVMEPDPDSPIRKKRRFVPGGVDGEFAESAIEPLAVGAAHSLVAIKPVTGRLHQIRATLLAYGYPIVGDKIYGLDDTLFLRFIAGELTDQDNATLMIGRQALHAWQLEIPSETDEPLTLTAPIPSDLDLLCRQLQLPLPDIPGSAKGD